MTTTLITIKNAAGAAGAAEAHACHLSESMQVHMSIQSLHHRAAATCICYGNVFVTASCAAAGIHPAQPPFANTLPGPATANHTHVMYCDVCVTVCCPDSLKQDS
jgi:hypothetical protein